jgi:hypothetical protein
MIGAILTYHMPAAVAFNMTQAVVTYYMTAAVAAVCNIFASQQL